MSKKKGVRKGSPQARSFAEQQKVDKECWTIKVIHFAQQEMLDAALITLANEFGFGETRCKRYADSFARMYEEIHKLKYNDTVDGEYSRQKVEEALQACCGKYYQPYSERYSFAIRNSEGNIVYSVDAFD